MANYLPFINLQPLSRLTRNLQHLIESQLWAKVLFGLVAGVLAGILLGPDLRLVEPALALLLVNWLALPGGLFLAVIQMIVVPLVVASIIRGLANSGGIHRLRKLGTWGLGFFVITTAIAVMIGLGVGLLVDPGQYISHEAVQLALGKIDQGRLTVPAIPGAAELPSKIVSLLPHNPMASMVSGEMLQVILFAIIFGIALINIDTEKSTPLFDLLGSIQEVCMQIVSWTMKLAPYAVFGLVARLTAMVGIDVLAGIVVYAGCVLGGLLLMLLVYVLLALLGAGVRPVTFLRNARELMLLAFSTSSSAVVMPLTLKTANEKFGVHHSVAGFLVPLGATVNMNGTALYQGVATVFLASVFGVNLDALDLLFVVVMAVMASIGSPATPGAGVVILAMVLEGVGIPAAGLALLLGADRILDMCRTAVNVTGDLTACIVLNRWVGDAAEN